MRKVLHKVGLRVMMIYVLEFESAAYSLDNCLINKAHCII